jgi:hypothetical protein
MTPSAVPERPPEQIPEGTMEGRSRDTWSGLMLDVEGARARVVLDLDRQGDTPQGEVRLTLVTEDTGEETKGRVDWRGGDDVRLVFELEGRATVEIVGRRVSPQHHAKSAVYGTYQARGGAALSLSAGVVVLWLYADSR